MIIFIKLLLAHFIGDFVLQSRDWVKDKNKKKWKSGKLYWHVLIHVALSFLILFDLSLWKLVLMVGLSHYLIDLWKIYFQTEKNSRWVFFADQVIHVLIIAVIVDAYFPFIRSAINTYASEHIFLLALALLLVTIVGSHIIKVLISRWEPESDAEGEESLSNAGSYIGMLERAFVFGFMVSGNLQAIGFLLAAKSIFRFGDLRESKDRKLTEYVLIGTLLSFGMAILVSFVYLEVMRRI